MSTMVFLLEEPSAKAMLEQNHLERLNKIGQWQSQQ